MPRPPVILTRPEADSRRVAEALAPGTEVIVSPVTDIVATGESVDLSRYRGVILTSSNAIGFLPDLAGVPVYCVGPRTAELSGGDVRLTARNADDLVARLDATGPLVHPHGREVRGQVAKRLNSAGIETHDVVIYDQVPVPLSDAAKAALRGDAPAILPLWSARSAARLVTQIGSPGSNLHVIALSDQVARAWEAATGRMPEVCDAPTGDEMIARIVAAAAG
ncbi:uroporphyrinogen-III synthase [Maritimibacter sp. DP07]|uniref:Uroporphyrinogen-III synthase n=1 Tax=Maritimibacter harenae TaxID=2606218 RepID=A0A845LXE9_9RHOB|nr:uroporphyrinogen-III synthase [Maritimibacter harenae]MZR12046.1 uroporphyrinogen-III synthase [Maritimibacter harenae]